MKNRLSWQQRTKKISYNNKILVFEQDVIWACKIPGDIGFCVILNFDEYSDKSEPNAMILNWSGNIVKKIEIKEVFDCVIFLSCGIEDGMLVLDCSNNFKYFFDIRNVSFLKKEYYR